MGNEKWEMGKWRNGEMEKWGSRAGNDAVLQHNWWVVKQESRVYMLCKVAQVFARGVGLDTLSFALPFSDEETNYMPTKCMHTLQLFDPCYF